MRLHLFRIRRYLDFRLLVFIGSFAYTIYRHQAFGSDIGRRVASDLLGLSGHLYFAAVVCNSLCFGIWLELTARKYDIPRMLVLGLKPVRPIGAISIPHGSRRGRAGLTWIRVCGLDCSVAVFQLGRSRLDLVRYLIGLKGFGHAL